MKDLKYLAAYSIPLVTLIAFYNKGIWSFATPVYAFVCIPILEVLLKEDPTNDNPATVAIKKKRIYYDMLLYLNLVWVYGLLAWAMGVINATTLQTYEVIGLMSSLGVTLGTNGINVAHELGHRKNKIAQWAAKMLLVPSFYMHFFIEHNLGHHTYAATKQDPATAGYKQNVYSFWCTSVSKQYVNAWRIQKKINTENNHKWYAFKNQMLWFQCIQLSYLSLVWFFLGPTTMLFLTGAGIIGFILLETVNYIEHYGLLREKKDSGRHEKVMSIHSWNSNHVVGRIILYELTRHSDHHYMASKKYQTLKCHEEAPQMPFGYPTAMVIALIPPLWFIIMNPRVPNKMKILAAKK